MLYSARLSDIMAHFVFKKAKAFQLAQQHPEVDSGLVLAVIQVTSTSHKVGKLLWGRKSHLSKRFTRDGGRFFNLTFQHGKCHPKQASILLPVPRGYGSHGFSPEALISHPPAHAPHPRQSRGLAPTCGGGGAGTALVWVFHLGQRSEQFAVMMPVG